MRLAHSLRSTRLRKGFSLLEILVVVVIILIVASIMIPNLIDSINKAKQKKTMAEMKIIGDAFFAWHVDSQGAASAGASKGRTYDPGDFEQLDSQELTDLLVPRYLQEVPDLDSWGQEYGYHVSDCCTSTKGDKFGLNCPISCTEILMIVSCGMDLSCDATEYTAGTFDAKDHTMDLVWLDGYFVRRPGTTGQSSSVDDDDQGEDQDG